MGLMDLIDNAMKPEDFQGSSAGRGRMPSASAHYFLGLVSENQALATKWWPGQEPELVAEAVNDFVVALKGATNAVGNVSGQTNPRAHALFGTCRFYMLSIMWDYDSEPTYQSNPVVKEFLNFLLWWHIAGYVAVMGYLGHFNKALRDIALDGHMEMQFADDEPHKNNPWPAQLVAERMMYIKKFGHSHGDMRGRVFVKNGQLFVMNPQ